MKKYLNLPKGSVDYFNVNINKELPKDHIDVSYIVSIDNIYIPIYVYTCD
jgi:hypothetical protein